jgi:hypothetical protein
MRNSVNGINAGGNHRGGGRRSREIKWRKTAAASVISVWLKLAKTMKRQLAARGGRHGING